MHELLQDLKNLKDEEGYSTDDLAERSGISKSTITRMFAGTDPRLQTVVDVAKVLGAKLLLSTDKSRQAFHEQDVRPFRELLAEKENTIKAKNEIIQAKDESIMRYEHHIHTIQEREAEHERQAAADRKRVRILTYVVIGILLGIIILFAVDSGVGHMGWIRY